jgi:hypothetical protein
MGLSISGKKAVEKLRMDTHPLSFFASVRKRLKEIGLEDFLKTWFVISVRKLLKIEGMENALFGANVKM